MPKSTKSGCCCGSATPAGAEINEPVAQALGQATGAEAGSVQASATPGEVEETDGRSAGQNQPVPRSQRSGGCCC